LLVLLSRINGDAPDDRCRCACGLRGQVGFLDLVSRTRLLSSGRFYRQTAPGHRSYRFLSSVFASATVYSL
ncbi:MAG TPA: hypothetical protein VNK26_06075, partial [Pyrinomonadaceae bacterium]|nr:hypothetical protein [Pyrinomonadaceae bacterium]